MRLFALCAAWLHCLMAYAQSPASAPPARPDPADPAVQVAAPSYASAFANYQAFGREQLANWRDLNDTAGVLAGHNAQSREVMTRVHAQGKVLDIERSTLRLRIEQEPIKALGWPAGVAFWQGADPALFEGLQPGARVRLTLEKDFTGDAYRVTRIEPVSAQAPGAQMPSGHKH
jgi:Cu/Ag efflux protein CusF